MFLLYKKAFRVICSLFLIPSLFLIQCIFVVSAFGANHSIKLSVKRVDAARFPEVDVYFTVIDNVPGTEYYDLLDAANTYSLTVKEGSFANVPGSIQGAEIFPMVGSLSVDRSGSMASVFDKVLEATRTWINALPAGDMADLVFFSGGSSGSGIYHSGASSSQIELNTFCDAVGGAGGMTPMYLAWNLSLGAVEDVSLENCPVRAAITLTDGYETCSGRSDTAELNDIEQVATSLDVPFFSIAFPQVREVDGIVTIDCNVNDTVLQRVADDSNACYFVPEAPYPKLPATPDELNGADPESTIGDSDDVKKYFIDLLTTLQNVVGEDLDAQTNFEDDFMSSINSVLTSDTRVTDYQGFLDIERDEDSGLIIDSVLNTDGTDPIGDMQYSEFTSLVENVNQGAINTVSDDDMNNFYNIQMGRTFTKIRESLKKEYHLTFTSPDTRLDGEIRDLELAISYQTHDNGLPVTLSGIATARFVAPLVDEEDRVITQTTEMDPNTPVYSALFGSGTAPRGGTWLEEPELTWGVELMGRDSENNSWLLGSMTSDGVVTLNDDETSPFSSVRKSDISTFLSHIDMADTSISADKSKLIQKMVALIPTCIARDRANPQADWPLGNEEAVDFRKNTLWYVIKPEVTRPYSFTKIVSTLVGTNIVVNNIPGTSEVKEKLPPLITYVYDATAPTISMFISPRRGEINQIEALEIETDKQTSTTNPDRPMSVYLHGKQWDPAYTENFNGYGIHFDSTTLQRADWHLDLHDPLDEYDLTANPATPSNGLFVYDGQRLEINILCSDNYDKAKDLGYMDPANQPGHDDYDPETAVPAPHNDYKTADVLRQENSIDHWPFLQRVQSSVIGTVSGFSATLMEDGVESELGPWHIFRTPNFPTGVDRTIIVKASDVAGNVTTLEIPIYVMPLGFNPKRLSWQSIKQ